MVHESRAEISLRHFPDESFSIHIPAYSHQNLLDDDDFLLQNDDVLVTPAVASRRDLILPLKSPPPNPSLLNVTGAADRNLPREPCDTQPGGSTSVSAISDSENLACTQGISPVLDEASAASTSRPRNASSKTLTITHKSSKRSVTRVATRPPITRKATDSDTVKLKEKTIPTSAIRARGFRATDKDFSHHPQPGRLSSTLSKGSTDPIQAKLVTLDREPFVAMDPAEPTISVSKSMKPGRLPPEVSNPSTKVNLSAGTNQNSLPTFRVRPHPSSVPGPSMTTSTSTSSSTSSSRSRSRSTRTTEHTRNPLSNSSANAGSTSDSNQITVRESSILKQRSLHKSKLHPIPDFKVQHAMHDAAMSRRRKKVPPTVPLPIMFSTEDRAKERAKFDERVKERELELERARDEQRRQREVEEEREIKELRRKAVPKAHEVPEWYKNAPKRDRDLARTRTGLGERQ